MDRVIFANYPSGFSSDNFIFNYASFFEASGIDNSNIPLLRVIERETTHENIYHYNIKHLQYIPVNTSYLELCQLTISCQLGDLVAISKGLALITCNF